MVVANKPIQPKTPRINVPKPLPKEQVNFFVNKGYLIVPSLVTPGEIEELKRDTAHISRGGYPSESLQPLPPDTTGERRIEVMDALIARLRPMPGVTRVAGGNALPFVSMGGFKAFTMRSKGSFAFSLSAFTLAVESALKRHMQQPLSGTNVERR